MATAMGQSENEKLAKSNQSVEKALALIESLAGQPEPVRLLDCAASVGLSQSTVLRLLATLQRQKYVIQDPSTKRYYLSMKICALAGQINLHFELKNVCAPFLSKLSKIFKESVNLSVEHDMYVLYIDIANTSHHTLMTMQKVGFTAPMHCTGSGKLMLLNYDEEQLETFLRVRKLPQFTPYTLCTREAFFAELDSVRKNGYSFDNQEGTLGMRCIAVPIYDHTGHIVAGISVSGPIARMSDDMIGRNFHYLLGAGRKISECLGHSLVCRPQSVPQSDLPTPP
jgi:DNA-binding IclR family transcriptional regulator